MKLDELRIRKHHFVCQGFNGKVGYHRWLCEWCGKEILATSLELGSMKIESAKCDSDKAQKAKWREFAFVEYGLSKGYDCIS